MSCGMEPYPHGMVPYFDVCKNLITDHKMWPHWRSKWHGPCTVTSRWILLPEFLLENHKLTHFLACTCSIVLSRRSVLDLNIFTFHAFFIILSKRFEFITWLIFFRCWDEFNSNTNEQNCSEFLHGLKKYLGNYF